jgi:hypothetical protein
MRHDQLGPVTSDQVMEMIAMGSDVGHPIDLVRDEREYAGSAAKKPRHNHHSDSTSARGMLDLADWDSSSAAGSAARSAAGSAAGSAAVSAAARTSDAPGIARWVVGRGGAGVTGSAAHGGYNDTVGNRSDATSSTSGVVNTGVGATAAARHCHDYDCATAGQAVASYDEQFGMGAYHAGIGMGAMAVGAREMGAHGTGARAVGAHGVRMYTMAQPGVQCAEEPNQAISAYAAGLHVAGGAGGPSDGRPPLHRQPAAGSAVHSSLHPRPGFVSLTPGRHMSQGTLQTGTPTVIVPYSAGSESAGRVYPAGSAVGGGRCQAVVGGAQSRAAGATLDFGDNTDPLLDLTNSPPADNSAASGSSAVSGWGGATAPADRQAKVGMAKAAAAAAAAAAVAAAKAAADAEAYAEAVGGEAEDVVVDTGAQAGSQNSMFL